MAHNVETMAYAGELPWHGLGTKVESDLLPYDMQIAAGLDWAVEVVRTLLFLTYLITLNFSVF